MRDCCRVLVDEHHLDRLQNMTQQRSVQQHVMCCVNECDTQQSK